MKGFTLAIWDSAKIDTVSVFLSLLVTSQEIHAQWMQFPRRNLVQLNQLCNITLNTSHIVELERAITEERLPPRE